MQLTKYMLATEKLAKSLEESGGNAESCVEDLGVSLVPDLPDLDEDEELDVLSACYVEEPDVHDASDLAKIDEEEVI